MLIYFSVKTQVNGAYVENGKVFYKGKLITSVSDLPISGEHNLLNFLATLWGIYLNELPQMIVENI